MNNPGRPLPCVGALLLAVAFAVMPDFAPAQPPQPPPTSGTPSTEAPPANSSSGNPLADSQDILARRFRRFEDTLSKVAETLRKTDPERANLLVKAIGKSKEGRVGADMVELVELLKSGQLGEASQMQGDVVVQMQALLDMLLSEDRARELAARKARLQGYIKDLDALIGRQTDARAATERGETGDPLEQSQKQIADKAEQLKNRMDRDDAAENSRDGSESAESSDSPEKSDDPEADAESRDGAEKGDDSQSGKKSGKSRSSQSKSGSKSGSKSRSGEDSRSKGGRNEDGRKADDGNEDGEKEGGDQEDARIEDGRNDADEDRSDENADPAEPAEPDGSDSERDASESDSPSNDSPSKQSPSRSGQKSKSGSKSRSKSKSQPGQENDQQQPGEESQEADEQQSPDAEQDSPSGETPGKEQLQQARREMQEALKELRKKNNREASNRQDQALKRLREAKENLERILRQLREEERERTLQALESRFQRMLAMERVVYENTLRLDKTPEAERGPRFRAKAVELARQQDDITLEMNKTLALLKQEGSSVAFPEAGSQVRDDMQTVSGRLERSDCGELTQVIESDIIAALEEMLDSLRKEIEKSQEQRQQNQQQRQQQNQQKSNQLVEMLSELKMLRSLQLRINSRTRRLARMVEGDQAADPDVVRQLRQLSQRQSKLQKAAGELAKEKSR
jgi:hypothetical protein